MIARLSLGSKGRHPFAERFGEPAEEMDLGHRLVIHRVVNLARTPVLQRGHDNADQIIAVNHVDQPLGFAGHFRFALQVFQEQVAAARPVNPGHAQEDGGKPAFSHGSKNKLFCRRQNLARLAGRIGRTGLLDQRAVGLSVNTGAARINKFLRRRGRQPFNQIARAVEIDLAILFGTSFA